MVRVALFAHDAFLALARSSGVIALMTGLEGNCFLLTELLMPAEGRAFDP